jgi:HSP20 family protein
MAIVRWDPLREMEDMFARYGKALGMPGATGQEAITSTEWVPRVDISETDEAYIIKAEIPGVNKDDVKVTAENGVLTISGERKQEKEEKNKKVHRVERLYGTFFRTFVLPDNVDESKINAEFKDGVLTLTIPKTEKAKPKSIEVQVH